MIEKNNEDKIISLRNNNDKKNKFKGSQESNLINNKTANLTNIKVKRNKNKVEFFDTINTKNKSIINNSNISLTNNTLHYQTSDHNNTFNFQSNSTKHIQSDSKYSTKNYIQNETNQTNDTQISYKLTNEYDSKIHRPHIDDLKSVANNNKCNFISNDSVIIQDSLLNDNSGIKCNLESKNVSDAKYSINNNQSFTTDKIND